jgi:hypothetical protein
MNQKEKDPDCHSRRPDTNPQLNEITPTVCSGKLKDLLFSKTFVNMKTARDCVTTSEKSPFSVRVSFGDDPPTKRLDAG